MTIDGTEFLLIGAPIVNRGGERVGTDVVAFRLGPLLDVARSGRSDLDNGVFIVHDASLIPVGDRPAELPPAVIDRVKHVDDSVLSPYADRVAVVTPVPVPGWSLILSIPRSELYSSVTDALVVPFVSMLVMVLVGAVATERFIRPLARRAAGHASELAETVAEQRLVLENARDFVYRQDTNGRFTYVSPAVERVTGYSSREWIERGLTLAPLSGGSREDMVHGTYQIGFPHRDGRTLVLEINEQAYSRSGQPAGVVGIARDVTDRVAAERALQRSSLEWSQAMDYFDDAIFIVDLEDRLIRANGAFYELTGLSRTATLGKPLAELLHPDGSWTRCPSCQARRQQQESRVILESAENITGRPVEVSITRIGEGVRPLAVLSAIRDLTGKRRTEQELLLAASVFEGSHEAILIADPQRRVLRINRALIELLGEEVETVIGVPVRQLMECEADASERAWRVASESGYYQGEASFRKSNGEVLPVWFRLNVQRDSRGELIHYIIALTDISDKKLYEERINHLAYYDVLTELPNRALFLERLQHALDRVRRQRHQLAVLFLDLDRFKNINDTLGHQAGDEVLLAVSERIRNCVRSDDTVARLGGDEFTVILEDVEGLAEVEAIARKILEVLGEPVALQGRELYIGGSIGISLFPEDGGDAEALLQHADAAVFRAKDRGRNTFEFYTPELTRVTSQRLQMENDLRRAIERDELVAYYQPQAAVADGRIVGAEALVRWQHAEKGLIAPGAFIPLAEETGLIEPIGRKVLFDACRQAVAWRKEGLGSLRMAVNIAGCQILEGNIVDTVREVLAATGIEPCQLELEITEGFVMSRPGDGIQTLRRLRELGVTLAIDDFGTGYSSLGYLKQLPVHRLKIDRSFVRDLPDDRDDAAIASTIIAMAGHLGLEVLAEGVEEEGQLNFLQRHECAEFQGFYLSPPVPAERFRELLLANRDRYAAKDA